MNWDSVPGKYFQLLAVYKGQNIKAFCTLPLILWGDPELKSGKFGISHAKKNYMFWDFYMFLNLEANITQLQTTRYT